MFYQGRENWSHSLFSVNVYFNKMIPQTFMYCFGENADLYGRVIHSICEYIPLYLSR